MTVQGDGPAAAMRRGFRYKANLVGKKATAKAPARKPQAANTAAGRVVEACLDHADDLIKSAKGVLVNAKVPSVAYHLATLALEEIGKGGMIAARAASGEDRDHTWIDKRLDDHIAKLFWALWTPSFGKKKITPAEIESARSMAKTIHENRLEGLYVAIDQNGEPERPRDAISRNQAENILELAEARLGLERSRDLKIGSPLDEDFRWFIAATDEPEKNKLIFGGASLDKLTELNGDVRAWVHWLREEFEKADRLAREAIQRELARTDANETEAGIPKWRVRIRIFSASHSIRPKALRLWNSQFANEGSPDVRKFPIKLVSVEKKKDQLVIELTLGRWVTADRLFFVAWGLARHVVAALNVGTLGFFWWQIPPKEHVFYEKIDDLENVGLEVRMHQPQPLGVNWGQRALGEVDIQNSMLIWVLIAHLGRDAADRILGTYIAGLIFVSKSDLNFSFLVDAGACFARTLIATFRHVDAWVGDDDALPGKLASIADDILPKSDERAALFQLPSQFLRESDRRKEAQPPETKLTMDQVLMVKTMCDVFLIRTSRRFASEGKFSAASDDDD